MQRLDGVISNLKTYIKNLRKRSSLKKLSYKSKQDDRFNEALKKLKEELYALEKNFRLNVFYYFLAKEIIIGKPIPKMIDIEKYILKRYADSINKLDKLAEEIGKYKHIMEIGDPTNKLDHKVNVNKIINQFLKNLERDGIEMLKRYNIREEEYKYYVYALSELVAHRVRRQD